MRQTNVEMRSVGAGQHQYMAHFRQSQYFTGDLPKSHNSRVRSSWETRECTKSQSWRLTASPQILKWLPIPIIVTATFVVSMTLIQMAV